MESIEREGEKVETRVVSDHEKDVRDEATRFGAISALLKEAGGKLLIDTLRQDICTDVEVIISLFRGEEMDLRCSVAKLKADLDLYKVLIGAESNARIAKEDLAALLKEEQN